MSRAPAHTWLWILALLACHAEGADAPVAEPASQRTPAQATTTLSEAGLYRVSLRPEHEPVRIGELHAWIVQLETLDGEPVQPTRFAVSGGMPSHGHGFETAPRVTRDLGGGRFLIEGVRFHMAGSWQFRLEWVAPAGADVAIVPVEVAP